MDADTYEHLKLIHLEGLEKTEEEYKDLEERTRLQSDSAKQQQARKNILTTPNFGKICKLRQKTSFNCGETVVQANIFQSYSLGYK